MTINVLFVCSGNICRSPMADGVFRDMVAKAGLADKIQVDSAGTGAWHVGETAHRGTLKILRDRGITYNERARQLTRADLNAFDYVLAMDGGHLRTIQRLQQETGATDTEVAMFMSYANKAGTTNTTDVPDPYYDNTFDRVHDLVQKGSTALLDHIREQHNL